MSALLDIVDSTHAQISAAAKEKAAADFQRVKKLRQAERLIEECWN